MTGRFFTSVSQQCTHDGCTASTSAKGLCRLYYAARYDGGSDGVRTGNKPKLTPEQISEAKRMWSQFKSNKEIAAHFGVTIATVTKALKHRPKDVAS